ncbi:MAG: amidophosphoribosyltransferase [Ruminococcaceae bacterium]|nr:amidophosphoribosyltransferase [Oscillospiraceae bacterium]
MFGNIHEECGVFGIFDPAKKINVTHATYSGLYALQHRGQQSCGIAVNNNGMIYSHNDEGLLNEVFNEMVLNYLKGNIAIGHVRYASSENKGRENNLPYVSKYTKGQIAVSYNGSLVDANKLRASLEDSGAMFHTSSDAEIFAYMISRERLKTVSTEQAVLNIMDRVSGAYSLVIMTPNKLIAVRDPKGFRPLCMGSLGESVIFASESCAIDAIGGKFIRDIQPGEVVAVTKDGVESFIEKCGQKTSSCIFEHIYFARPDSVIDGQSVHFARQEAGRCLARRDNNKDIADIVIGVPDSGLDAALGYARESGIPYSVGLNKNRYIGRTFIQTQQGERENLVRLKLNPMPAVLKGKRVVIVDDSIVRGTTCAHLIELVRHAGATEVHLRISSPPFLNPCYFGTDIDSRDKLIACRLTLEEIRQEIGADSLAYLAVEDLKEITKDTSLEFCDACFTGNYPVHVPGEN